MKLWYNKRKALLYLRIPASAPAAEIRGVKSEGHRPKDGINMEKPADDFTGWKDTTEEIA